VELPENLTEEALIKTFGRDAFVFYENRLRERVEFSRKIYRNPLKTIFLWAREDKAANSGFFSTYRNRGRGAARSFGGS
jgi:hypothetical protein